MNNGHVPAQSGEASSKFSFPKVVQLSTYRRCAKIAEKHQIFYITSDAAAPLLRHGALSRVALTIDTLQLFLSLRAKKGANPPDLILIDSFLPWADPLAIIHYLNACWEVPTVMLCNSTDSNGKGSTVKAAYTAGIQDALYPPFHEEDILETIEILLKLKATGAER